MTIPRAELDPLGLLAAAGDDDAMTRLCEHFKPNCSGWVEALVAAKPEILERRRDELRGDAAYALVNAIKRYKGTVHLPAWIAANVKPYIKGQARKWWSRMGSGVEDRGQIDLTLPGFKETATVHVTDEDHDACQVAAREERKATPHGARYYVMKRMQRLTFYEKQVFCRREGIPLRWPFSIRVPAMSFRAIARDLGIWPSRAIRFFLSAREKLNVVHDRQRAF